jgi:Ca-activated chloride channel family protein
MIRPLLFIIFSFSLLTAKGQAVPDALVRGNEYYRLEQYSLAEAQYRKVLEETPGNETAIYNLANALHKQKKFEEAARTLQPLYGSTKNQGLKGTAYYNEGVAFTQLKKLEESIESYKNALRTDPKDQWARENLQKALQELKKKQQQQQQKQKPEPKMSQKEAEQKLKMLEQKERNLQQRMQRRGGGGGQSQDW